MSEQDDFKKVSSDVPKKKQKIKKPTPSKKSERFEVLEQRALKILGDDYWDWLEKQYTDLFITDELGK